jgi:aspartate aminotransferase
MTKAERGGRGLAATVRGVGVSPTLAIQEMSAKRAQKGLRTFRFGLGQSPFPVPQPVVDALRLHAAKKDYLPVRGLPALREAVAEYHRRRQGIVAGPDDVLVAPGSKELMFLLQVVFDGELILPTPAWVSYAPQAHILGRKVTFLGTEPETGYRLTADELECHLADSPPHPRVLVLNYPSNPTGTSYDPDEIAALAEVARRHEVIVLSDEIYGELHFRGEHFSIARLYPEGTIVSSGLSKWCGAGGWRLGTFVYPQRLRWLADAMAAVASETYSATSAPIQHAAVKAFQGGLEIERYLVQARHILRALCETACARLRAAQLGLPTPDGAFYLFVDFDVHRARLAARGITRSSELATRLLAEAGVAALPGAVFGRPEHELTLRLSLVDFDGAKALAAAEEHPADAPIDAGFLRLYCGPVLEGLEALIAWLLGTVAP